MHENPIFRVGYKTGCVYYLNVIFFLEKSVLFIKCEKSYIFSIYNLFDKSRSVVPLVNYPLTLTHLFVGIFVVV